MEGAKRSFRRQAFIMVGGLGAGDTPRIQDLGFKVASKYLQSSPYNNASEEFILHASRFPTTLYAPFRSVLPATAWAVGTIPVGQMRTVYRES